MRGILYFTLLFVVFGSPSLFAVEQLEEKKVDAEVGSVREDAGKNLKQDSPQNTTQQKNELEPSKSDVDKLNVEKTQNTKAANKEEPQHDENKAPAGEKAISVSEKSDKDFDLLEESKTPTLPSVKVNRNLVLPPSTSLNTTDLQKDLQVNKKSDAGENKPSENNTDKLLEEKKVEEQVGKEEVKKLAEEKNPITKKDEENRQEEKENLQKWTKLTKESIKEWDHKNAQSKSIYKRQYDDLNEHLPTTVFVDDYSKQLFYCIKKNNLVCLRGIISKLGKLGLTVQDVLRFRNKFGDTPLIYAVKQDEVDIVRFLLLQGADPKVVNNSLQSPIDIAIKRGRVDMVNAIAEMTPRFLEPKRIDNKESLEMYNWAVKTKEDNELQCNKEDD
ncbi:MAG: ankyrin repeat domain-containing protein [Wolbachia sp.]